MIVIYVDPDMFWPDGGPFRVTECDLGEILWVNREWMEKDL